MFDATDSKQQFVAGRNLAVLAFREMLEAGSDRCSIEVAHRDGEKQCDVLFAAIAMIAAAPAAVVNGFAAVFTDVIGCECRTTAERLEMLTAEEMGAPCSNSPSSAPTRRGKPANIATAWPFETVNRARFDRLTERQKGMLEHRIDRALDELEATDRTKPQRPQGGLVPRLVWSAPTSETTHA